MPDRSWFVVRNGKQDGPFSDQRLREMIAGGAVKADTLLWCEGMTTWTAASAIPGLMSASQRASAMPPALGPAPGADPDSLFTTIRAWPLFGRFILIAISYFLVIPLPWAATSFLRWLVDHIQLPRGRATFAGRAGDIWYVFVLYALCLYGGGLAGNFLDPQSSNPLIGGVIVILTIPITAFCALIFWRWFFAKVTWQGQTAPLQFTGSYWALLGWLALLIVSIVTIVGWAWVYTAWFRWMCRHVTGSSKQLIFRASGWSYLWRTVVFQWATIAMAATVVLLVLLPWLMRWYVRWKVSQFSLVEQA
jgi:hypothetical protein